MSVVLVHGLWMTPLGWENWSGRFADAGHEVLAPAWPGFDRPIEELRAHPEVMNGLGVEEVTDHYARIIGALPEKPIIMGHSFGGLITQKLLSRGLGRAGVVVHSAPAKGTLGLPFSSLKASFPVLKNPANVKRAVALSPKEWHYAFANTLSFADSEALREKYAIAASGRPLWQAATANVSTHNATAVDLAKPDRAPLLFIASDGDNVVPASMNRENHRRYRRSPARTEIAEFPNRPHFVMATPGWEEVADHAIGWAEQF